MIRIMAIRLLFEGEGLSGCVDDPWMAAFACHQPPNGQCPVLSQSSRPAHEQFLVQRRGTTTATGEWPQAQTRMPPCRIALRPCSIAISGSWCGWLVGPPTVCRRATPPRCTHAWTLPRGAWLADQRGLLDAKWKWEQFASKPHDHPAVPTRWALVRSRRRNFDMFMPAQQPASRSSFPAATNQWQSRRAAGEQLSTPLPPPLIVQRPNVWQTRSAQRTTSFGNSPVALSWPGAVAAGEPTPTSIPCPMRSGTSASVSMICLGLILSIAMLSCNISENLPSCLVAS
ncbi:hypothetical protein QBC39DRAFT_87384 [Podospora conica]|nr:hypothetical protein QBC39DRAFT_87384 [Schizothecium conicum]